MRWDHQLPDPAHTLDDILTTAGTARRPVLVELGADWCAACRVLDREVYSSGAVADAAARFETVRIDVDRAPELATQLAVHGLPTVVFVDSSGAVRTAPRMLGTVSVTAMLDAMAKVR